MGLRMKNFSIMGVTKNPILKGGVTKNQYIGGIALKGGLGQCADLRGGVAKKEGVVFSKGG